MAKKRVEPAPVERKRVMVSFSERDYQTVARKAKEAGLKISTYARLLILGHVAPGASQAARG